jgi:hypothetical protein
MASRQGNPQTPSTRRHTGRPNGTHHKTFITQALINLHHPPIIINTDRLNRRLGIHKLKTNLLGTAAKPANQAL